MVINPFDENLKKEAMHEIDMKEPVAPPIKYVTVLKCNRCGKISRKRSAGRCDFCESYDVDEIWINEELI